VLCRSAATVFHHLNSAAVVVFAIRLLVTKPDIQQFHHFSAIVRYSAGYQKRRKETGAGSGALTK
jgi:hypothetical protein